MCRCITTWRGKFKLGHLTTRRHRSVRTKYWFYLKLLDFILWLFELCYYKKGYVKQVSWCSPIGLLNHLAKRMQIDNAFVQLSSHATQAPGVRWSSGEILEEFVWKYLRPLLGIKNTVKFWIRNTSPCFHSTLLAVWPLAMLKRTCFGELSISRFTMYIRKALR